MKQRQIQEERDKEAQRIRDLKQKEEEEKDDAYKGGYRRGGRGGRGRGGFQQRDNDDYRRAGAGRGSRIDAYRQKNEFEGDDDDNSAYTQPARPQM